MVLTYFGEYLGPHTSVLPVNFDDMNCMYKAETGPATFSAIKKAKPSLHYADTLEESR